MTKMSTAVATPFVKSLCNAFDALIAFENQPTDVKRSRNGWAAYKGSTRITKFYFSEEGAREAGIAWDASDVKVQF